MKPDEALRRFCARDRAVTPRAVVLAAHPDDDVIGAGGRLAWLRDPLVVHMTDGAPRDVRLMARRSQNLSRAGYAKLRTTEARAALALAGVTRVVTLNAVDQEAIERAAELVDALARVLDEERPDVVVAQPYEGGHPDHDAAALVAFLAAKRAGVIRLEMTSYHGRGGRLATGEFLEGDGVAIALEPDERDRKRRMLACHASQRETLAPFGVDVERFRVAREHDFTRPPHEGALRYEQMGWAIDGLRWRARAREVLGCV